MFHNVSLKIAYPLCVLISVSNLACSSIESLLQKPTPRVELKDWSVVTDQETINHLVHRKRGIFALAEENFVVVYPKDKLIVVPDCGHVVNVEKATEFNRISLNFLSYPNENNLEIPL